MPSLCTLTDYMMTLFKSLKIEEKSDEKGGKENKSTQSSSITIHFKALRNRSNNHYNAKYCVHTFFLAFFTLYQMKRLIESN